MLSVLAVGGLLASPSLTATQLVSQSTMSSSVDHAAPGGPHTAPAATGAACQPVKTFPAPPPGFDPVQANDAQLRQYGFPPRPPGANAGALIAWRTAMSHIRSMSPPSPICSNVAHTAEYSGIWAGHVVPHSYVTNATFTWAESSWTQPSVPGNSNYSNYNDAPDASFWTGLGISSLIQAGAE